MGYITDPCTGLRVKTLTAEPAEKADFGTADSGGGGTLPFGGNRWKPLPCGGMGIPKAKGAPLTEEPTFPEVERSSPPLGWARG